MTITADELYINDLFYLTRGIEGVTLDPKDICAEANIANVAWETRAELMDSISAVLDSPLCTVSGKDNHRLAELRHMLATLAPTNWNARIDTVEKCVLAFQTDEWTRVREVARMLLPALKEICAKAGISDWLER